LPSPKQRPQKSKGKPKKKVTVSPRGKRKETGDFISEATVPANELPRSREKRANGGGEKVRGP